MSSTNDDEPSAAYAAQVSNIIAGQARASSWQPAEPIELFIRGRRLVTSIDELGPIERAQLERLFRDPDLETALRDGVEEMPLDLEVATVEDEGGAIRYRFYAMNYGAVYVMAPEQMECVAFASQHDVERWRPDQRDLFWAIDRALRRGDHGVCQPLSFDWWTDARWAQCAPYSEPYIRKMLETP